MGNERSGNNLFLKFFKTLSIYSYILIIRCNFAEYFHLPDGLWFGTGDLINGNLKEKDNV